MPSNPNLHFFFCRCQSCLRFNKPLKTFTLQKSSKYFFMLLYTVFLHRPVYYLYWFSFIYQSYLLLKSIICQKKSSVYRGLSFWCTAQPIKRSAIILLRWPMNGLSFYSVTDKAQHVDMQMKLHETHEKGETSIMHRSGRDRAALSQLSVKGTISLFFNTSIIHTAWSDRAQIVHEHK